MVTSAMLPRNLVSREVLYIAEWKNMVYKNFRINVIFRILLITISLAGLIYFVLITGQYLRSIYIFVFIVLAIVEFIWYVDRTNRDFASFLLGILQNDFSVRFNEQGKGKSFKELYSSFNKITDKFKLISTQKELQHQYLQLLVDHISVGILSFDEHGNVHLMNNALKKFLDKPHLNNIDGLEVVDKQLLNAIKEIKPGENKLLKFKTKSEILEFAIQAEEFKLEHDFYKLISLQNIKGQLEESEMIAWQKLIRILTHEIMNSVAPITSLTSTLHQIVLKKKEKKEALDEEVTEKIDQGLLAIINRSQGLMNFTEAYRNLTKIPPPNFEKFKIIELIERINILFKSKLTEAGINFQIKANNESLEILADPELLSQVIINLIKNASEALRETTDPKIVLTIKKASEEKTMIGVSDNGPGIPPDTLDKIFVPFFTTKDQGSGIGLSLSKQIIQRHKGNLSVQSVEGKGTSFTILI
ncbi:ATP-binding protein [Fulvivirgaceae bacterium BMA10]|uniref:histidine kinase n=1 Tax=Splendidivirga corallicola TaxID=3051826 RepID=A0ABT8KNG1_9BACT|nr:ATP-binding protein [Fulvivirgaceae bacterium BMA10]